MIKLGIGSNEISKKLGISHIKTKEFLRTLYEMGCAVKVTDEETHVTKWFSTGKPFKTPADVGELSPRAPGKHGRSPLKTRMVILTFLTDGKQTLSSIYENSGMAAKAGVKDHVDALIEKGFVEQTTSKGGLCPTCHQPIVESSYEITSKGLNTIKQWNLVKERLDELGV